MFRQALMGQQRMLVQQQSRGFARVPMIKFIGKRTKTDKSVGVFQAAAPAAGGDPDKKAVSPMATLEFADIPADRWARLPVSELEMEVVNLGTNEIDTDWSKIRL